MDPIGLVCPLGSVGATDRAVAGGKGASLAELHRVGLPVPPGFVITVRAFERAMHVTDPANAIGAQIAALSATDPAAIASAAEDIRGRIASTPLAADLATAVTAAYLSLGPDAPVAVRSSAVGEDAAEASFAGLQDTYLWVRGRDAVLERVRQCWASLYNTEAVGYRLRQRLPEQPAMAVVVQRMIDPQSAGVMFTCSPMTGDRSVIAIEGSWGLGSVLVGGEVTPDSFVVSKVTGDIVRRTVATKARLHREAPDGTGTTSGEVPADLRDRPCLDDDEIRSLAQLGLAVEQHYGTPQDIEWAVTGDEVVLLQSRAETVWTSRPTAPAATPKARPMDHVFEHLGRPVFLKKGT